MSIYVYIENNAIQDIAKVNPFDIFEKDYASKFIEAPDEVTHFWTYDGENFHSPVISETTKWNLIRDERNKKLTETDWKIIKLLEQGTEIPESLKTYRQTLRDIPNTYTNPDDVVWPEMPTN